MIVPLLNPSQVPDKGGHLQQVSPLACQQLPVVWSHLLKQIVCSQKVQTFSLNTVSGAQLLTLSVLECDVAHRRSVAVLCMLYKIRCNRMHPLNDALPGPYVPVRVTSGALVSH